MTFGEFLKQILEHLYGLWPLRIVNDWEQGVRVVHGNATTLLTSSNGMFGTGLHCFWPLIGEFVSQDTNIETPETGLQTLTSKDWKPKEPLQEGKVLCNVMLNWIYDPTAKRGIFFLVFSP